MVKMQSIVILADTLLSDGSASHMLRSLHSDLSNSAPELLNNPSSTVNRADMERMIRSLCETYGTPDDKIYQAKKTIDNTANVMRNNIGSMLQNQNKLGDIESASNSMRSAAQMFSSKGRLLEQKIKRRNRIMMLAAGSITLFFVVVLIVYFS